MPTAQVAARSETQTGSRIQAHLTVFTTGTVTLAPAYRMLLNQSSMKGA